MNKQQNSQKKSTLSKKSLTCGIICGIIIGAAFDLTIFDSHVSGVMFAISMSILFTLAFETWDKDKNKKKQ